MTTATKPKKRRNVDPDVALARGTLAGMASRNSDPEEMARVKAELERAKEIAALRKAVRNATSLSRREIKMLVNKLLV